MSYTKSCVIKISIYYFNVFNLKIEGVMCGVLQNGVLKLIN